MFRSAALVCVLCVLASCQRTSPAIELSGPTMGTTYSVKVVAPPPDVDSRVVRSAIDEVLARIDARMSTYRPDSEISRFNAAPADEWLQVSGDLAFVIEAAQKVSEQSAGALDITIAPLVSLWGMGPDGELKALPDAAAIDAARSRVGYRKLELRRQPPALRKQLPELTIDLNAVAPGYAVDLLCSRLTALGVKNVMVDIGGEVRALGRNALGEPWRIAVERPIDAPPKPYAIARIDDAAITTSGEYRHYIVRDGRRYSHTIDPRTGRPVEHRLASVVVVQPTALEADAWATALNVLGEHEGFMLAERLQIPALFIVSDGSRLTHSMTTKFEPYLAQPLP